MAAGVPGAGGEDAIFILAVRHTSCAAAAAADQARHRRGSSSTGSSHSTAAAAAAGAEEELATGGRAVSLLPVEQATAGVHFSTDTELRLRHADCAYSSSP